MLGKQFGTSYGILVPAIYTYMYVILHMRSFNQVRDQVSFMEEIASLFILRNNVVLQNNYTD